MMKHLSIVLKKMCECAEVDFESIDFKEDEWYLDNSWSDIQKAEFKTWVYNYLKDNKEARVELMNIPSKSNKVLEGWFSWFDLGYGFKDENND